MTVILAALVLLQAPDREAARVAILRLLGSDCGENEAELKQFARLSNAALEELPAMIKEAAGERRKGLLYCYGYIAGWNTIPRTPAVILNLARGGDIAAAQVVFKIRDKRSIDFMLECLAHMAADERTESFALEREMLEAAGRSHSDEVGKRLFDLIDVPHMRKLVIEPLGTLGYFPARDRMKELTQEQDKSIAAAAHFALSKIGVPATAEALVARVRSKWMSGEFSWYEWALKRIVDLNLKEAAPALREEYDEFVRNFGAAHGVGWSSELLFAIHQLGGKLTPEETKLLTDFGRLAPATLSEAGEEKLVEGFDKSVWAPRAQRLKEIEARNAPSPRFMEKQLPAFMRERINFVMSLAPPDPSYLAPDAVLALETIEERLVAGVAREEQGRLLQAYVYLAGLREGMKTPGVLLDLAGSGNLLAVRAVTTIADARAEEWYVDALEGPRAELIASYPGRLYGAEVMEALLRAFRASDRPQESLVKALVDRGCTEILADFPAIKGNRIYLIIEKEKLEILTEPDREKKLLATVKSLRMSDDFSWYLWALDQIVRLDLKGLAPDLRAWYDKVKEKCPPSPNPYLLVNKMPWVLRKLGAPITKEEEELIKRSGRGP